MKLLTPIDQQTRGCTNPELNGNNAARFKKKHLFRRELYSSTNFGFHHGAFWLLVFGGSAPYLVFSTIGTFLYFPDFPTDSELYHTLNTWISVFYPLAFGVVAMIVASIIGQHQFYQSGGFIFVSHFYLINLLNGIHALLALINTQVANWYALAITWVYLLFLSVLMILGLILIPDLRRGFLLLLRTRYQVDQELSLKLRLSSAIINKPQPLITQSKYFSNNPLASRGVAITLVVGLGYLAAVQFSVVGNVISSFIVKFNANEAAIQQDLSVHGTGFYLTTLPTLLLVTIFAPFLEELAYRKGLMGLANNKWYGIFASALVFGLIHTHGSSIFIILGYMAFGFVQALNYGWFGNFGIVFAIHALTNTISFPLFAALF